jgi:uncharacterized protein (DUF1697 family)
MRGTSYIALVHGINVGKAKRVAMTDLRAACEELGYENVRTLLNSGNVVFRGSASAGHKIAARIEQAMDTRLGVTARVTVLTAAELTEMVAANPLLPIAHDASRLLVAIINDPADQSKIEPLLKQDWTPDSLGAHGRAAFLWCASGILESPLAQAFGRAFGKTATTRNWATVLKLHAMVNDLS